MACLSRMELSGNSTGNQIFFDTLSLHENNLFPLFFAVSTINLGVKEQKPLCQLRNRPKCSDSQISYCSSYFSFRSQEDLSLLQMDGQAVVSSAFRQSQFLS